MQQEQQRQKQKLAVRAGLALCALVVLATVSLLAIRVVAGPRTVEHISTECPPDSDQEMCTRDEYSGSVVSRPWLLTGITLSICAVAVALSLRDELRRLSS